MLAKRFAGSMAALAVIAAPQVALAKECITQAETEALAIYGAPAAMRGAAKACANQLPAQSFLRTGTGPVIARYDSMRAGYWPLVSSGLTKFLASENEETGSIQMLTQLPEESVRPIFDAFIEQEVAKEMSKEDCNSVNRIAASVAPLDPQEFGGLFGAIMVTAMADEGLFCTEA